MVPGRLGRLECRGEKGRVYVFTDHSRKIPKLSAIPGVHRWQIGDGEAAFWVAAGDAPALQAVAGVIRTRIRRPASPVSRFGAALRVPSAPSEPRGVTR